VVPVWLLSSRDAETLGTVDKIFGRLALGALVPQGVLVAIVARSIRRRVSFDDGGFSFAKLVPSAAKWGQDRPIFECRGRRTNKGLFDAKPLSASVQRFIHSLSVRDSLKCLELVAWTAIVLGHSSVRTADNRAAGFDCEGFESIGPSGIQR